jgi:polysaccharide deacetylase family protein (PEP-CTERM system associated)
MDQVQQPVRCYRAPSFSIVSETLWATDVLVDEGFSFDSSMFPVQHDLYGIPDGPRFPHWHRTPGGRLIFEFPPSTLTLWNKNWGVAGGGYLRLAPYPFTKWAIRHINETERQPAMVYFHPWEIDPEQPQVPAAYRSILRHYVNLSTTEAKIEQLLADFSFTTLTNACHQLKTYTSLPRQQTLAATA